MEMLIDFVTKYYIVFIIISSLLVLALIGYISNQSSKKDVSIKKKKDKKPSKFGKKVKETTSELKKVTWPTFGSVVKKTGVVLAVVLIFAVVLFGIDRLLAWIFSLLIHSVA